MGDWHLLTIADSDVPLGMDAGEQARALAADGRGGAAAGARRAQRRPTVTAAALRLLGVLSRRRAAALAAARVAAAACRCGSSRALRPGRAARRRRRAGWQTAIELLAVRCRSTCGARRAVRRRAVPRRAPAALARRPAGAASLLAPLLMLNERGYSALDLLWLWRRDRALWVAVSIFTRLVSGRLARATGASARRAAADDDPAALRAADRRPRSSSCRWPGSTSARWRCSPACSASASASACRTSPTTSSAASSSPSSGRSSRATSSPSATWPAWCERIGGRSTVIRTLDRVSIIVPNAKLLETELVNWSHGDPLVRLHVPVGVAYGSDIETVRAALLDAAQAHPGVLADPRPEVRLTALRRQRARTSSCWCGCATRPGRTS